MKLKQLHNRIGILAVDI